MRRDYDCANVIEIIPLDRAQRRRHGWLIACAAVLVGAVLAVVF